MSEYLSGDQLYRFLHISKRKMKFLLENGYIPVIDTEKKTYRYRVKRFDAEKFKERMEREADFLRELKGQLKKASELAEISPQRVNELVRKGVIYGMCVGNVQYLSKEQLIEYIAVNCRIGKLVKSFGTKNKL